MVIHQHRTDWRRDNGPREYDTVKVVASITRGGLVKRFRRVGDPEGTDSHGRRRGGEGVPSARLGFEKSYVMSTDNVAEAGALAAAACHVWGTSDVRALEVLRDAGGRGL